MVQDPPSQIIFYHCKPGLSEPLPPEKTLLQLLFNDKRFLNEGIAWVGQNHIGCVIAKI